MQILSGDDFYLHQGGIKFMTVYLSDCLLMGHTQKVMGDIHEKMRRWVLVQLRSH